MPVTIHVADPIAFSTITDLIVVHFGRGNVDKVVGIEARGFIIAAPAPWRTREAMSMSPLVDSPHRSEATVKTTIPMTISASLAVRWRPLGGGGGAMPDIRTGSR